MNRAVLVTGMAWSTALGTKLDEVWSRLLSGESGIREVPSGHQLRNRLAAPIDFPPADWAPARRQVALAADTLTRALDDAGLTVESADPWLVAGTSYGAHLDDGDTSSLQRWAVDTAAAVGITRPPVSLSTACSSGSDAILVAAQLIESGATEVCVCGGADILTAAKRLGHTALGTMSPTLLRSFDQRCDGTLLGEGAGFLVLESAESAMRRGAGGYAVFRGGGASNDAAGMTAPDPSGDSVLLATHRSLADSGLGLDDVAVISAHGSGTPVNDAVEALSFTRLFPGERRPMVFATKGAFGHTLGATGAIEAIALVLALRDRRVPPVYGLADRPRSCPLPAPGRGPSGIDEGVGVSLTLGFGGFNTSLVFEGVPGDLG